MLAAGVAAELAKSSANRWLGATLLPHPCFSQLHHGMLHPCDLQYAFTPTC